MFLLEEAECKCSRLLTQMNQYPGSPSALWAVVHNKNLLHLKAKNHFRKLLVLGCHGLEADAACFRKIRGDLEVGSPPVGSAHQA